MENLFFEKAQSDFENAADSGAKAADLSDVVQLAVSRKNREGKMKILIVVPAYNEVESIERVVKNIQEKCPHTDYVIVSDGSTDGTVQLCQKAGFHLLRQPVNLGLAGTFQTGVRYALQNGYDAVVQIDGDGQHRLEYVQLMCEKLAEGWDIVIGSRFVSQKKPHTLRMLGSRLIQHIIQWTTGSVICDPTSGMRLFGPRILPALANEVNCAPEPDTLALLLRSGAKVTEIQVEMNERTAGVSYLNPWRSAHYMAQMCANIVFLQLFTKKIALKAPKSEGHQA